jgi:hypothetical protein
MEKFLLTVFFKIAGISSASGIVLQDNSLFIISDNSGFLYEYNMHSLHLKQHVLIDNSKENILKKNKPDFEAITLNGNELHVFGSGSTKKRNRQLIFNTKTKQTSEVNLEPLYQKIKKESHISNDDLNIEGALYYKDNLHLFQRGNGANAKNGIAIVNNNGNINFQNIKLPKIKHVETSFTDAILVHNKIYFLASAEDTISTYDDGEVLGSIIGCIDIESFKIDFTIQISNSHKFEGITLFKKSESHLEFLLCEDNDTEELETKIYKLTISKK